MELVVLAVLAFAAYKAWKWWEKVANNIYRRERERKIETAIRFGLADAEAAERISRRIQEERGQ